MLLPTLGHANDELSLESDATSRPRTAAALGFADDAADGPLTAADLSFAKAPNASTPAPLHVAPQIVGAVDVSQEARSRAAVRASRDDAARSGPSGTPAF